MSDAKSVNEEAYDHLATWYLDWVSKQTSPRERYARKVLENASRSPSENPYILELGCGPGVPITRMLLDQGARVLANDISTKQIAMAKAQCHIPQATFVAGDMAGLSIEAASVDGVVCFFTLFHLPRTEQKPMLSRIFSWLKPGGLLVCNFATFDEEEIYGEMMGHGIFWSGFDAKENRAMLVEAGFEIESEEVLESDADGGNEFQWIAARKPLRGTLE
jgi:ubiquinone/menaquinone biosynthesis C-methylase UbiE